MAFLRKRLIFYRKLPKKWLCTGINWLYWKISTGLGEFVPSLLGGRNLIQGFRRFPPNRRGNGDIALGRLGRHFSSCRRHRLIRIPVPETVITFELLDEDGGYLQMPSERFIYAFL
jgi:hypothetical protein